MLQTGCAANLSSVNTALVAAKVGIRVFACDQGVPADVASKLPEQEVVSRTLAQLDRMFGEAAPLRRCCMDAAQ